MVGIGRQLFVPLTLAVGFAMLSSYLLSSTLVPVLSAWFSRGEHGATQGRLLEGARSGYGSLLRTILRFLSFNPIQMRLRSQNQRVVCDGR